MHTVGRARFKISNNRVVVAGLLQLLVLEYAVVLLKSMNYMIILFIECILLRLIRVHNIRAYYYLE